MGRIFEEGVLGAHLRPVLKREASSQKIDNIPTTVQIYVEYKRDVARWLGYLGVPSDDIEDLLHDVFVVVEQKRENLAKIENLPAWLFSVTRNIVQNERRRFIKKWKKNFELIHDAIKDNQLEPDAVLIQRAEHAALMRALLSLSEKQQTIVVLAEWEGLSGPEIAKHLSISEGDVWVTLHRVRKKIRTILEKEGFLRAGGSNR